MRKVIVTQDIIDNAEKYKTLDPEKGPLYVANCPIAQALRIAFPGEAFTVLCKSLLPTTHQAVSSKRSFFLASAVSAIIYTYDKRGTMKPFEFEAVPDNV